VVEVSEVATAAGVTSPYFLSQRRKEEITPIAGPILRS